MIYLDKHVVVGGAVHVLGGPLEELVGRGEGLSGGAGDVELSFRL